MDVLQDVCEWTFDWMCVNGRLTECVFGWVVGCVLKLIFLIVLISVFECVFKKVNKIVNHPSFSIHLSPSSLSPFSTTVVESLQKLAQELSTSFSESFFQ